MQAVADRPSASYARPSRASLFSAPIEAGGPAGRPRPSRPILVVDDDPSIRALVVEALIDDGYDVVEAADGAQALALIGANNPCLILLDMRMPVLDGWGFARTYRSEGGTRAPIVVMTAARDARTWANEIEADGVLPKPFDLSDLSAVVERFC
jgi:CheY-like chemotaxis protein